MAEANPVDEAWERETICNWSDAEPTLVHVWTSQRSVGRWLEKVCLALKISMRKSGRPTWEASLPRSLVLFRQGIRPKRTLSPEQRAACAERLAKVREKAQNTKKEGTK